MVVLDFHSRPLRPPLVQDAMHGLGCSGCTFLKGYDEHRDGSEEIARHSKPNKHASDSGFDIPLIAAGNISAPEPDTGPHPQPPIVDEAISSFEF